MFPLKYLHRAVAGRISVRSDNLNLKLIVMNSVAAILNKKFSSLPLEEKVKIKELGRPTPELRLTQKCEIW